MLLENRIAVVTGSSRGIGRAIALRFAAEGADVVVNCHASTEAAEGVAEEIRGLGRRALVVAADVRARADAERLVAETLGTFGRIEVMVANAGVIYDKPLVESGDAIWEAAIDTILRGAFNVVRAALPAMIERGFGRLLATGSLIAEAGDFGDNHYGVCAAAKGGIPAMMRHVAAEVADRGITANVVSPGYIATRMLSEIDTEGARGVLARVPMHRYGKPEEIAAAMAFLASDDAAYITGQVLRVNGGLTMG